MINPLILWSAGGALMIGLFAGWSVRDWKADADTLAAYVRTDQLREKMQAKIDAPSRTYEDWRADAEVSRIETRNTVREIYRDVEVPAACDVPASARGLLENRVTGANAAAAGEPRPEVPQSSASAEPAA